MAKEVYLVLQFLDNQFKISKVVDFPQFLYN